MEISKLPGGIFENLLRRIIIQSHDQYNAQMMPEQQGRKAQIDLVPYKRLARFARHSKRHRWASRMSRTGFSCSGVTCSGDEYTARRGSNFKKIQGEQRQYNLSSQRTSIHSNVLPRIRGKKISFCWMLHQSTVTLKHRNQTRRNEFSSFRGRKRL